MRKVVTFLTAGLLALSLTSGARAMSAEKGAFGGDEAEDVASPKVQVTDPSQSAHKDHTRVEIESMACDYWISCEGSFHMCGTTGRAIYLFGNANYDTSWTFTDDLPVGGNAGWTYKEDGYTFYMFFSRYPSPLNGMYEVMYSRDNVVFHHYAWAR